MKYFYDTEFIESGPEHPIELISIGIVAEDGRELYMQSCEFDAEKASPWVQEHVFSSLVVCPRLSGNVRGLYAHAEGQCVDPQRGIFLKCPWRTREELRDEVLSFMDIEKYGKPELWGYYSAYDHVAFCQLFGTMMDLPKGFPMYTRDIKQLCDSLGNPQLPVQGKSEHNALADARWNKNAWEFLMACLAEIEIQKMRD